MNWYLVKIVFRIVCGSGHHTPQFDEQLRLIAASGEDEALLKAKNMGEVVAEIFQNAGNEPVQWQFIAISELYKLSHWMDGAELYSAVKEVDNAESYISLITAKAASLKQESKYLLNLV